MNRRENMIGLKQTIRLSRVGTFVIRNVTLGKIFSGMKCIKSKLSKQLCRMRTPTYKKC